MTRFDRDLSDHDANRRHLIEVWLAWQADKPSHQRLFFNFHEQVVRHDPRFVDYSLLDTLAVLNTLGSFTQHGV